MLERDRLVLERGRLVLEQGKLVLLELGKQLVLELVLQGRQVLEL